MADLENRKRGGQPGNHNASKYGRYYQCLNPTMQKDYLQALKCHTLDPDIALVRSLIRRVADDPEQSKYLPKLLSTLDGLVRCNETLKPRRSRKKPAGT